MLPTQWLSRNAMTLFTGLVILAYAAFIQWMWGWETVLRLWSEAGWSAMIAALLLLVSTYVLRTWRIYDYFPNETKARFAPLFRVVQIHNLLNIMLPFRSGETSFPLLMRKEFGVTLVRGTSALLVMRLFDLHALLAAAGIGLAVEKASAAVWLCWAVFLLLPVFGFAMRRLIFGLFRKNASSKTGRLAEEVHAGLPVDNRAFLRAWGVTLINWFVKIAVLTWVLMLMGGLSLPAGFGGALGGELSSVLPVHAPGGVGTYPAGITAGAIGFGAPAGEAALSALAQAAVNVHLLVILSSLIGTSLALFVPKHK
ncbi:lysylphosphatidylglycerol synthase transmembrane domain-containing protein [Agrobacterium larrymoorei]|uniref:lysylphosphatidylglycerol synthase transmembrane domain-containing protein n=1 Tax=Agrobacterium larrymoorei TaxID=160699 RepID=UPI001F18B791|nr:lysylphosphatidylglycerol synthase transmembrane domain-containing protein [Agrobacterium larrymoorei]